MKRKLVKALYALFAACFILSVLPTAAFAADPPVLQSALVTEGGSAVELTFDKEMSAPVSGLAGFEAVRSDTVVRQVTAAGLKEGDNAKIVLTLQTTIKGGEVFSLKYTPGTVQSADGVALGAISSFPITNDLPHPTLSSGSPPNGTAGTPYYFTFTATDGTGPYGFYCEMGSLPSGLTLDNPSGVLSGTPTQAETAVFTIMVVDQNIANDSREFSITIGPAAQSGVCEIGATQYATLDDALGAVQDGQTIRLLKDVAYESKIEASDKSFIIDANSFKLTVNVSGENCLSAIDGRKITIEDNVGGGSLEINGSGMKDGFGIRGLYADGTGSSITVTVPAAVNVSGTGNIGVYAGGKGIVDAKFTNINNTAGNGYVYGLIAYEGGTAHVGNITVNHSGNWCIGVYIYGDVLSDGQTTATVDGTITVDDVDEYIRIGTQTVNIADQTLPTTKAGYRTYKLGSAENANTVWVKIDGSADTTPPSVPENVREIDRTKSSITISWDTATDVSGIAGYDIQMKQGGSGVYSTIGSTDGSVTEFTKTDLQASTTYYFQVRSKDGSPDANISEWSAELSATTKSSSSGGGGGASTPELVIGTANPPDGTVGTAYTHTFTANGGSPSYTFAVTGGALPNGLSIVKNGTLSGTPTLVGAYNYTITVTDSSGRTSPHTFAHVIKEGAPALAALLQKEIILTVGSLPATVDGQSYTLDAKPFIDAKASRTMVPLRFISEALGAEVHWQVATRQVIIKDGDKTITLTIDSLNALVNGTPVTLDTAPVIIGSRTFVPLRFISETLGATVDYEASTGRITITR